MAQPNDKTPLSIANLGAGAFVLMLVAAFFGLRSSGTDDKPHATSAKENTDSPSLPSDSDGNDPSRAFILNYLRARSTGAVAMASVTAQPPLTVEPIAAAMMLVGSSPDNPFWQITTLSLVSESASARTFTKEEANHLDILIATVPDPIDTAFGFWYDQIVESLTRAICDTNLFAPSGQWNPWQLYQLSAVTKESKKPAISARATPFERFPGVLLFRGTKDPERVIGVLLVSETANAIRAEALKCALNLALELQQARNRHEKFRLIAPIFSGSQVSLLRALRVWTDKHDWTARFEVITGSATSLTQLPANSWEQTAITLHATIIPWDILQNTAVHFLHRPGDISETLIGEGPPSFSHVALLVESNTGLGRLVGNPSRQEANIRPRWPMYLPFPMHMSRLLAAYAKRRVDLEKRIRPSEDWLDLSLEERPIRPNADMVPSLDEAHTAPINDRALDDTTATIRENQVRLVGIIATDPRDRVSLVQRIKRDCPKTEIFVVGMDLSYTLPENQHIMRGVAVTTTYPLHPPNLGWTESDEPRRQTFKSQCGQGCYNAAAFHLFDLPGVKAQNPKIRLEDLVQEYTPPAFAADPTEPRRPPVWIVTIGEKGRLVPLAFSKYGRTEINNADAKELVAFAPPPSKAERTILPLLGTYRAVVLLVLVANVGIVGAMFWLKSRWVFFRVPQYQSAKGKSAKAKAKTLQSLTSWWRRYMGPMDEDEQRVSTYQNLLLTPLIFSLVPLLAIAMGLVGESFERGFGENGCLWAILGSLALAGCIDLILQIRIIWRFTRSFSSTWNWSLSLWAHVTLAVSGLAFGILLLGPRAFSTSKVGHILFIERSTAMLTGWSVLSAIVPMCAGFLVYSYFALKLDYLGKRFEVESPYELAGKQRARSPVGQIRGKICTLASELHKDLTDFGAFRWRYRYHLLIGGLAFLPAAALVVSRYRTWEGLLWNTVFLTGFLFLAVLVLITLLRFVTGWKRLEQILKLIALIPMVGAFDRLPRKTAALFGGYLFARRPRLSHLNVPAHILRQLQHEAAQQTKPKDARGPLVPVLATAYDESGQEPQLSSAVTMHRTRGTSNGVQSRMPKYEQIPKNIARLLSKEPLDSMPKGSANERGPDPDYPRDEINKFSKVAKHLIGNLEAYWPWHTVADAFGEQAKGIAETDKPGTEKAAFMPSWVEKAEDFVAIQAIIFLSQYFILLRTMALSMVWVSVLLLIAATEYPFQPEQLILYLLLGLLGAVVVAILWVFIRVNRSEIVSRITQSTPNKFEFNLRFVQAVVQFVGPIAIVTVAQLSGRLRAIVEPLLEVIR